MTAPIPLQPPQLPCYLLIPQLSPYILNLQAHPRNLDQDGFEPRREHGEDQGAFGLLPQKGEWGEGDVWAGGDVFYTGALVGGEDGSGGEAGDLWVM